LGEAALAVLLLNYKVDMKKQFFALGTAAIMTAMMPNITAADAEVEADVDLPKAQTRTEIKRDKDVDVSTDARVDREKVKEINKASGLIGMEVRNSEDEKLGEIKDLVMEMDSGRVSYAVLSVGGFLGIGEKLIALPPGALETSDQDSKFLVLNADKAKIQAAPGFAATAWPAPGDPEISQFWNDLKATGAPASSETRKSGDVDVDVDKKDGKVSVDADAKKKIYTDADKDKNVKVEIEKD
jgi:sporulation protein YlmC with PRC-barrel domain